MKRFTLPLLLLVLPGALAAQSTRISTFVASDDGVRGTPVMMGVAVGRETQYLGVRWNAAVNAPLSTPGGAAAGDAPTGVLTTEVDALLFPLAWAGELAISPYALAGGGLRMVRDAGGSGGGAVWSYGAGFHAPLTGWLQLEGEARRRAPFVAAPELDAPQREGWEFRAGLGLRFGRSGRAMPRTTAPARPGAWPAATALPAPRSSGARHSMVSSLIDTGDDFLGVRYRWGGNTPDEGFDCSGFVSYVYARHGIRLPRVSRDQAQVGTPLPLDPSAFLPGDLLAFDSGSGEVDHIAIYVGNGQILHSSSSGDGVRYDDLFSERGRWFREHMVSARRVIPAPTGD